MLEGPLQNNEIAWGRSSLDMAIAHHGQSLACLESHCNFLALQDGLPLSRLPEAASACAEGQEATYRMPSVSNYAAV